MGSMTSAVSSGQCPFLPGRQVPISAFSRFLLLLAILLTAGTIAVASTAGTAAAADTPLQQKEAELQDARKVAEAARSDIRSAHPGDSRPPEAIIQGDIAFESHLHQKLVDAKGKLAIFDAMISGARVADKTLADKSAGDVARMIASGAVKVRDTTLASANQKLAPFFTLDANGTLQIGPAFFGLPVQFPATGGISIEGARSILNTMINDNAAMQQKREDQLAALGNEKALENELNQLQKGKTRGKIVGFWVECSPPEITPSGSSLCVAHVQFENGDKDSYSAKATWNVPGGSVRGDSAAPGSTVTVSATYQATPEEGGGNWSGSDRVHIRPEPPPPPPPPLPQTQGTTTGTTTTGPVQPPQDHDAGGDQPGGGSDDTTVDPPRAPFSAELDCPPSFELVPGDFTGKGCGIIVRGWNPNGGRVEVDVDFPERSGIEIFPGDTSADASQMHNPGVSDFHDRYIFSESIRAKDTAQPGVTTVRFTVRHDGARIVLSLQISVLSKGQVPSPSGIRPQVNMATGGGTDAKWCVWRYRALYEPPECFLFAKAECFKYGLPKYELVGQQMTWMQAEALMSRLSRYGGDAYGCLKAEAEQWQQSQQDGGRGQPPPPEPEEPPPAPPEEPPEEPPPDDGGGTTGDTGGDSSGCQQDADCPKGYVCDAGQCVEPFDQSYATSTDILNERENQRDQDIIDRTIADQGSSTSTGGGFTSSDLDKDMEATQEAVSSGCRSDHDCPSGQRCENGTCGGGQKCAGDSDCPPGSKCSHGTCTGAGGGQGLTITPANKVAEINEPVTFQATAGGSDVTSQTTWTPGNPFKSGSIGQFTVNATYQNLSGSASVTVVEKKGMDDITVNSKTFTVSFFDHGTVDGDMIDILVNNKAVFSGITLTKAPQSRTITMQEDVIVLGFKALNEGKIPPNTATVTFSGVVKGKSKQDYTLEKNQKTNMNVTYQP